MNTNIIFKTPSLKRGEYFSIIKDINTNLEELTEHLGDLESAEIKLYDTIEDNRYNNKAALINIKFEKDNFMQYHIANKWDKLIIDVFQRLIITVGLRSPRQLVY
jgi:hypothetical protein